MDYDVLIVSNNPVIRADIRGVLETTGGFESGRICEAKTGNEAIKTIDDVVNSRGRIGVIITETSLRGTHGFHLLRYIINIKNYPPIPVIITPSGDSEYSPEGVLKLGASGYLPKTASPQEIVSMIRAALAKQI